MSGAAPAAKPLDVLDANAQLSDLDVVALVRAGDLDRFEVLMRRHNQRLYRAARAILRDEAEVEDVLQETYLAAYRNLDGFEGRARFSTWLTRIAVNQALDRRRKRSRLVALEPDEERTGAREVELTGAAGSEADPEQHSACLELARCLEAAIDALPDPFRSVYVLREVEGLSTRETAESLGLDPATVKTRLHRARARLKASLLREAGSAGIHAFPFGHHRCDRVVAAVLAAIR